MVEGSLELYGARYMVTEASPLQDLSGLESLVATSSLTISSLPELKSLAGLDNLRTVQQTLSLSELNRLSKLTELSRITSLDSDLSIVGNYQLRSLEGLDHIRHIQETLAPPTARLYRITEAVAKGGELDQHQEVLDGHRCDQTAIPRAVPQFCLSGTELLTLDGRLWKCGTSLRQG